MNKSINILDKDYLQWVQDISKRYRQNPGKGAVHFNRELVRVFWALGMVIV